MDLGKTPGKKRRRRRGLPSRIVRIRTYEKLEQYLKAFAEGHFDLLILVGTGGAGKSRAAKAALAGKACVIEGNATAFGIYQKLYRHKDELIVIDDIDDLYADKAAVRLLKCLCQSEEEKCIGWHSDSRSLERQGIPREFSTKSRVIIVSNDWQTLNKHVAALQDRGHVVSFEPTAAEVHQRVRAWFDDEEIYEWLGRNLHRIREPSQRHYRNARQLKRGGLPWTDVLAEADENKSARLAAELLASAEYTSTKDRVKAFIQQGGGCRATFFNHRRKLAGGGSRKTKEVET
jgi:hypothetical protein